MNPDIKALWLTALRSGEYVQTGGGLKIVDPRLTENPVRHCCLGVLCDLAVKAGIVEEHGGQLLTGLFHGYGEDKLTATLPEEVMKWAGVDTTMGSLRYPHNGRFDLADLNDSGYGFPEIADIIEEQF